MMDKTIYLKGLKKIDSDLIYTWKENENLRQTIGTVFPISEYEHEKWFEKKMLDSSSKLFSISYDDIVVGLIGYNHIDYINRNAEIFIFIGDEKYRGKGIGTQALQKIINFSKNNLNLHMIYLYVFSNNEKAINLYKSLEFQSDGILRESKYVEGKYIDILIMSKIL